MSKGQPTLEGFYFYLMNHSDAEQTKYLKYGLGRLAKEHPNANPREALIEFFVEHCHKYERSCK